MKTLKNYAFTLILNSSLCVIPSFIGAQNITAFAGTFPGGGYSGNGGAATAASLATPMGIACDASGNVYIADQSNNVIRKVNSSGIISAFAGVSLLGGGYTGDGGQATAAELRLPFGLTIDTHGNVYIADESNSVIRKVNSAGIISTVAGNHTYSFGYSGDNGAATTAELDDPTGVAVDASGNLYIADQLNNVIRMVNTAGIITTYSGNGYRHGMGNGGYSGDNGAATSAELDAPTGIALDAHNNLFIADDENNAVRMVTTAGVITTVAGSGNTYDNGDGGQATSAGIYNPYGVAFDASGNYYIADWNHNVIRKVTTAGIISTVAGNNSYGYYGFSGNGGPATNAELNYPSAVAIDHSGNLIISDEDNNVVRRVNFSPTGIEEIQNSDALDIYPNPNNGQFTMVLNTGVQGILEVYNVMGEKVFETRLNSTSTIDMGTRAKGMYLYRLLTEDGNLISTGKFLLQ